MENLINTAIKLYKNEIVQDAENTDAIFFIIEELGCDMNESEFEIFNTEVMKRVESL